MIQIMEQSYVPPFFFRSSLLSSFCQLADSKDIRSLNLQWYRSQSMFILLISFNRYLLFQLVWSHKNQFSSICPFEKISPMEIIVVVTSHSKRLLMLLNKLIFMILFLLFHKFVHSHRKRYYIVKIEILGL